MNVLFIVPYVPSLVRARSYNLIRHLSDRGHSVTVAAIWVTDRDRAEAEELRKYCDGVHAVHLPVWRSLLNCARGLASPIPLQAAYSWSRNLFCHVEHLVARADVVHVEHLRGVLYGLRTKSHPTNSTPIIWDSVDCISYLFQQAAESRRDWLGRLITRFELPRTRQYEGMLPGHFERVLVTSRVDKAAMTELSTTQLKRSILVLPNGVDTNYFTPSQERRHPKTLVFSGKMSYHANVRAVSDLVTAIMPAIWARQADVRLLIVGKDPPDAVRALASRHAPLVTVTGTVPDIRPFLQQATAAVAPLVYGAGSQFKVLEAMACETPVVASPRAISSLMTEPGRDVLIAEDTQEFADTVLDLVGSPTRQREIGQAGRRFVEVHHRWDRIAASLEAIYQETLREHFSRT